MTGNMMHLPATAIEARLQTQTWVRDIWLKGIFRGFELRLDNDIATYCKLLLEIYAQGKERIDRLARDYPLDATHLQSTSHTQLPPSPTASATRADKQIVIRCALDFYSGTVHLSRNAIEPLPEDQVQGQKRAAPRTRRAVDQVDTLKLPGIAVWLQYRGQQTDPQVDMDIPSGQPLCDVGVVSRFDYRTRLDRGSLTLVRSVIGHTCQRESAST